ncbi:hypothetical protein GCM10008090_34960 [Arenicella chitinivorans]|uniref:Uncharacterized protein n=1 Tax=Arenicella chitinivorans TaxID=1329800 RepID=A0A918S606_9GAMM|nr:hypothetical protein [Arenicella chitinivorans]GHA22133.1 hypothetical protein GCM10008090_34960 [Arenicella chitinivorans]
MTEREELLLKMYDQLFNDINRHIMVVWQSVGVLVGAFAIFALVEKNVVPIDIASSIILLLCSWLIAHLLDASYWYNRNLVMIANIERQFLDRNDLKEIHYYFGVHRPKNKMIEHLKLQFSLGSGLGAIVLFYHLSEVIIPAIQSKESSLEVINAVPYILVISAAWYLMDLKRKLVKKYEEFLANSPGKDIDASDINYGVGHGH